MVYDHHCPWINNCVGARNYVYFFLFILAMESALIATLVYSIYGLSEKIDYNDDSPMMILHIITSSYSIFNTIFVIPLTYLCFKSEFLFSFKVRIVWQIWLHFKNTHRRKIHKEHQAPCNLRIEAVLWMLLWWMNLQLLVNL